MTRYLAQAVLTGAMLYGAFASAEETGPDLYHTYCAQCHGVRGNGQGINVRDMSVQPRDHTDRVAMSGRSDDDLFKAVKEGGQSVNKSLLMPSWKGALSDDEIRSLVQYLRVLCQCKFGS